MFNPYMPDGHYELDLRIHEVNNPDATALKRWHTGGCVTAPEQQHLAPTSLWQDRCVAEMLVVLAEEPGENFANESYNGMPFEVSVGWLTDVSSPGHGGAVTWWNHWMLQGRRHGGFSHRSQLPRPTNRCRISDCSTPTFRQTHSAPT